MTRLLGLSCFFILSAVGTMSAEAPVAPDPTRIIIECEDMKGVEQDRFGPGKEWQVGRWGQDLYQNMIFGGVWASRLRMAMTDAGSNDASATKEIEVPADGTYKVWAKYECPPFFNYAFGIKIEPLDGKGAAVFDQKYGLLDSAKHYCFTKDLRKGSLYWNWGMDHDAAEGYEAKLRKGKYRVTLYKTKNPEPAGARSVDTILITSDLSPISSPRMDRYPLLDELRRANHVYFRFRNPAGSPAPVKVAWNHWNHRYPDFYQPFYRELVKFYDEKGARLPDPKVLNGDWPELVAPGKAGPWYDLGVTMNTESTSPYTFRALAEGAAPTTPSAPLEMDIALEPSDSKILKSFKLEKGEDMLCVLVQPDLYREEGVERTKKMSEIYREITKDLNEEKRLGPIPKKMKLFGGTGAPTFPFVTSEIPIRMEFRQALGLNTFEGVQEPEFTRGILEWSRKNGNTVIERSMAYHHSTDPKLILEARKKDGQAEYFHYLSYGDEIGLPPVDVNDAKKVEAFREYLRKAGETPEKLGFASWDQVKPMAGFSSAVAVQIGVLPKEKEQGGASELAKFKRLYWHSCLFTQEQGIESFAGKTAELRAGLGDQVHSSANLGGMHPFYWMHQASFIESFKHKAMTLAWSEDYTYCMPEATRLVADFETAYLRKGASYHNNRMMFYCMPHWPGITPEALIQNAVIEWGQNVKDLDFFGACPDIWSTENYVAYRGGLPTWKAIRTISGMAGLVEDHLVDATTEPAPIAMLLSESSDVWEVEGQGQGAVNPGTVATNVSQEERKAIWYALRNAGYRVDFVTEEDVADGLLKNYKALYICGQNLQRKCAPKIKEWVQTGGAVFGTAGAARKDEFDEPFTDLDEMFGRGKAISYQRYKGPLRARLELLFEKPLDSVKLTSGEKLKALCSREEFEAAKDAKILATFEKGGPALIEKTSGKGRAYYTGMLPGQAYIQAGLPVTPMGKGGSQTSPWGVESLTFDPAASKMIRQPLDALGILPDVIPNQPGVATNRLKGPKSTVISVVNLAQQQKGALKDVKFSIHVDGNVKRAWSCFHSKGLRINKDETGVIEVTLPTLETADVIVLE